MTNGMANSGADGNSIKSIFQENRISSFNFHSALFVSCLYVYKWRGRGISRVSRLSSFEYPVEIVKSFYVDYPPRELYYISIINEF